MVESPKNPILTQIMAHDKPLVLVDGSSYLFRAYHALPPLTTSQGHPTGAIRGVIAMLRKLAKDYPGSAIAVIFDPKGKTFRDDLYPEYKANRPAMEDDMRVQIRPIHEIIRAMGMPLLIVDGVEADDVIGTLAFQATAAQQDTVISTSDKDMAQLVSPHVTLVNTMSETTMDRDGVIEKFGVPPELIIDYLALMGDTSDNIPGVPKVGPKTAAKWLNLYGSLDEVMASADDVGGKVGENLRASLELLPLSRQLTTIKCDVEIGLTIADLAPPDADRQTLRKLFETYEFRSWIDELGGEAPAEGAATAATAAEYETVTDLGALDGWLAKLTAAGRFALNAQTTDVDYMRAELVGVSFAVEADHAAYVPVGHDYPGAPDQIALGDLLERFKPLLEDPQLGKLGQDLKYVKNVLARYDIELVGIEFDTMLESYVLDSVATRHTLADLAERYLSFRTIQYEDVAGKGVKQLSFNEVPIETASLYAAEEADIVLKVHEVLWPRLTAEASLRSVFEDIELPLLPVLSRIERAGARVDGNLLLKQGEEIGRRLRELAEQAWAVADEQFNLDSTKQLQSIFYDKLGLPVLKKTPGGKPSTAEPVLQELALDYELPRIILEYRGLAKLKSTYTDKLPLQINAQTGRIHTSYHQAVAATGRLSSKDPNLQNIPIRTAEGRKIRQAFVAAEGRQLLAADYSQIELRIMAHLSGDAGLRAAFAEDLDVHRATAAEVFGCNLDEVDADQRRSAKAINFGLMYGMSAFGLGRQLGVSRGVAQEYMDRYFGRYPGVHDYMEQIREQARSDGFVATVFGRRLYLPEINAKNGMRRQAAERTAINAPMQGTAADIIKRAMISVDRWLGDASLDAQMIMQVHDELVFEVAQQDLDALSAGVVERMESAAQLEVPLVVDVGCGDNWDEAH